MTIPTEFHLYQVLIMTISFFMIYQGTNNFIKGKSGQTFLKLFVRIVVWGGMTLVTIFPELTVTVAKTMGIIDNINAVILTAFLLVFLMIFKLLSAIERLEQQMTELTRKDSLRDL